MMMKKTVLLLLLSFLSAFFVAQTNAAPIDSYEFKSQTEEDRFRDLVEELRCLKCQNTNLAGSNAPLAKDHRDKVYAMMQQGKTDLEIKEWFVARYGDFVLYRPQVDKRTWALWGLPLILVPLGLLLLWLKLRGRNQKSSATNNIAQSANATSSTTTDSASRSNESELSDAERKKLEEALK